MKAVVEKLSCKYDDRTDEEKSLKMNFWIPENTPEYKEKAQMVTLSNCFDIAFRNYPMSLWKAWAGDEEIDGTALHRNWWEWWNSVCWVRKEWRADLPVRRVWRNSNIREVSQSRVVDMCCVRTALKSLLAAANSALYVNRMWRKRRTSFLSKAEVPGSALIIKWMWKYTSRSKTRMFVETPAAEKRAYFLYEKWNL